VNVAPLIQPINHLNRLGSSLVAVESCSTQKSYQEKAAADVVLEVNNTVLIHNIMRLLQLQLVWLMQIQLLSQIMRLRLARI